MKANHPHVWWITLTGKTECKRAIFNGRLDEALAHADELESAVRFVVLKFSIARRERVKKAKSA